MPVSSCKISCVFRAIPALNGVGSARASSNEFVWRDWVPPKTAAIASTVVRTTLLYGTWEKWTKCYIKFRTLSYILQKLQILQNKVLKCKFSRPWHGICLTCSTWIRMGNFIKSRDARIIGVYMCLKTKITLLIMKYFLYKIYRLYLHIDYKYTRYNL